MQIYDYSELSDTQIIYRHKPSLLYLLIIITIGITLVLFFLLFVYLNLSNNYEEGQLLTVDKKHIIATSEGYIENKVSALDNTVKKGQTLAIIQNGDETTAVKAPKSGVFNLNTEAINGSYIYQGTSIGVLDGFEDMYVASLFSDLNFGVISEGDLVQLYIPELDKKFEGEIYHKGITTIDRKMYNIIINIDEELKDFSMRENMDTIINIHNEVESIQSE